MLTEAEGDFMTSRLHKFIWVVHFTVRKGRQTLALLCCAAALVLFMSLTGMGCSSGPAQPKKAAADWRPELRQQQAKGTSQQEVRTAWPDPEHEAAKIGVQLYPGAKA